MMTACQSCGLEHELWVTYVPGLGRQHDYAPLGFDGSALRAYGNDSVAQVYVSSRIDFTVRGWPLRWLCQWCAEELEHRNNVVQSRELRAYDRHVETVHAGQLHLDGPPEWWCV